MTEFGSVNTGTAHDEQWNHPTVRADIWKPPQPGPRMARRPDLDGDGQSDTAGDDGGQRAIRPYQRAPHNYRVGVSADAAAYGCGRAPFMAEVHGPRTAFGLPSGRIRAETFGVLTAIPPGVTGGRRVPSHLLRGRVETAPWSPSLAAVSPCPSIRRARHHPGWPRPGTSRVAGPAAPSCWPDRPATSSSRSNRSLKARCSSAVPGRQAGWSPACEDVASEVRLHRDQPAHA
jgi:hypothetical protein